MTEQTLTLDLLRHGEPQGGRRFRGSQDDPLTTTGWEQMQARTRAATPWSFVLSSPLKRCRNFAEALAEQSQLTLQIEPDLQEIHFGDWEGISVDTLMHTHSEALQAHWDDPINNTPPGGESLNTFRQRIENCWENILQRYPAGHGLIVAHGGTIRILICRALGLSVSNMWRLDVPYASLSRITVYRDKQNKALPVLTFHAGHL